MDQRDQRVLALWKEKLMANCPEAERWRPLYQMAAVRREVLKRLQASLDAHDDTGVVQWGSKHCLANYPLAQPLAEAIAAARQRLGRSESLLAALANAAEGIGEGETDPAGPAMQSDDQDAASEPGENGDIGPMSPISPIMPPGEEGLSPSAGDVPPSEPAAASPAPPTGFREQFDAAVVRAQPERFSPYQAILEPWIRSEVLPLEKLGLALPADHPALIPVEEPEGHFRATWVWPDARFSEECLLAVCPAEPTAGDDPQQIAAHWRETVTAAQWTADAGEREALRRAPGAPGRLVPVEKSWEGSSVVVWAAIDLGFQKLYSPPLILGQIPFALESGRSRWKWPRLFARQSGPEEPS